MIILTTILALWVPDPGPIIAPPPALPAVPSAPPVSEGVKDLFMVQFAPPKILRSAACEVDAHSVAAAVRRQVNQLKYCYENQLKTRQIVGRLRIVLSIDARGRVTGVEAVEDEVQDTALTTCIARRMRRFTWPATNEPYTLAWPIVFSPAP
jgi:hypothetical protein